MTFPNVSPTYVMEDITVPANGSIERRYEFRPDQIFICSPAFNCALGINIKLVGAQGGSAAPLLNQGPVILPGLEMSQGLRFESLESEDVTLLVIAQQGYLPVTVTMPTTTATTAAGEILPSTVTSYEEDGSAIVSFSFDHNHPGGALLVFAGIEGDHYFYHVQVNAVTAGGDSLVLVCQAERWEDNASRLPVSAQIYIGEDLDADSTLTIACTIETAHGAVVRAAAVSLGELGVSGSIYEHGAYADDVDNALVTTLDENSIAWACAMARDGPPAEESGGSTKRYRARSSGVCN